MLRASKAGNLYEGSTYEYGKSSTTSGMLYDPTNKFMVILPFFEEKLIHLQDKSGLPELTKLNHVISYKADEVAPTFSANVKASNLVEHQQDYAPIQDSQYPSEKLDSPREEAYKTSKEPAEEEKDVAPSEAGGQDRDIVIVSSIHQLLTKYF